MTINQQQKKHLKYYSLIHVRSTRGRNSKGSKITGIEVLNTDENKVRKRLIKTNKYICIAVSSLHT